MADSSCIFCEIVAGRIGATKIYEDESVLSFLDINPISDGHVLVITKQHFEKLHDYVKKAKEVLERNQITVQNHMPRQLIPVKLQQLTRPNWSEDFEH